MMISQFYMVVALIPIILGSIAALVYMKLFRIQNEALALIDPRVRMEAQTFIPGAEFPEETRSLYPGEEFYFLRHVGDIVICSQHETGEIFFMRVLRFVEAMQESRVKASP